MQRSRVFILVIGSLCAGIAPAAAATHSVAGNNPDCGPTGQPAYCLIADAIAAATDGDVITVAAGIYVENLVIEKDLTINGESAATTIVDGNAVDSVVVTQASTDVTLNNVTIRNGSASLAGGIVNGDRLTLTGCIVEDNVSVDGAGGIYNAGTLRIQRSTIRDNDCTACAGGAINSNTILKSFIEIVDSTLAGNYAAASGGALAVFGSTPVRIINSTISGNASDFNGGGLFVNVDAGVFVGLYNTTVTNNIADQDNSGGGSGGGIAVFGEPPLVENTIIAANIDDSTDKEPDCHGEIISQGHNILGDGTGCIMSNVDPLTDQQGDAAVAVIDPLLGPLSADNGGSTPTHALLAGSPAVDKGDSAGCRYDDQDDAVPPNAIRTALTTDQRGEVRAADGDGDAVARCDIGAFEIVCGDDLVHGSESCDDGNAEDGDYCSSTCSAVTGSCGDSTVQTNEVCDDSNTVADDGCSADCSAIEDLDADGSLHDVDCNDGDSTVFPDAIESCDGIDNDCDGTTDENFGSTTCGVGACVVTTLNCVAGATQSCTPSAASTEACADAIDNDCDGTADEVDVCPVADEGTASDATAAETEDVAGDSAADESAAGNNAAGDSAADDSAADDTPTGTTESGVGGGGCSLLLQRDAVQ